MAKRRKKRKTKRTCLRCDRQFLSEGIYNRICPNCRESNANIALYQHESAEYPQGDIHITKD
jgi:predicted RNA-binding Zn-ribbon protein involved in translation (DUF1610 family)